MEDMAPRIPYKMIVVYLTTLPTLRAYNSLYMQDYFKQSFLFSFLSKMSMVTAKEIETVFFHSLGNPRVTHLIISFVLKISIITSPTLN